MTHKMFSKRFDRSEVLFAASSPMAEATDGVLKFLVGLITMGKGMAVGLVLLDL